MPISGIFSSLYNLYPQSPAPAPVKTESEKLAENIIYTWNLANGDMAHLLRDNDKLDCLFVRGDDGIMVPIPIPDSATPEEIINRLLEMHPVLISDSTIDFVENEIENEIELHTWDVKYGNSVNLVCIGEKLKYRTLWGENQIRGDVLTPDGLSLEKQVEWAKERYPHVYSINKDVCHVLFEQKVKEQNSAIDRKIPLDMNHWCVTFFNAENSIFSGLKSWGWMGHAVLMIETIEEGGYFSRRADLTKENGKAHIRFFEITRDEAEKYGKSRPKAETHRRPREDIQRMLNQISLEVQGQEEGNPLLSYKIDSGKMKNLAKMINLQHVLNLPGPSDNLLLENVKKIAEEKYENYKEFNCGEWGFSLLLLANIHVPLQTGSLLSKMFFPTPVLYAGSKIKAIVQETGMVASYVALYSLPYIPRIAGALVSANHRSFQGVAMVSTWGLIDVVRAYSAYYFPEKQSDNTGRAYGYRNFLMRSDNGLLEKCIDVMGNFMGTNRSVYSYRERIDTGSPMLNWGLNDFIGMNTNGSLKDHLKELFTINQLLKIQRMGSLQQMFRN